MAGWVQRSKEFTSVLRGNLLVLTLSWVIMNPATNMVGTYEQPYILAIGATPFILGAINAISTVVVSMVRAPGGYIADRWGRKKIIVTMTFSVALSYLLYALAPTWQWFLMVAVFHNLCLIYQPALNACVADSLPVERRGVAAAIRNFLPAIFSIPAPLVALYLVSTLELVNGMRLVYVITAGMLLIAASLRWFFLKETLVVTGNNSKIGNSKEFFDSFKSEYLDAVRFIARSLPAFVIFYVLYNFAFMGVQPLVSIFTIFFLGVGKEDWGLIKMASLVVSIITVVPIGVFVDKLGRRRMLLFGLGVLFLSALLYILVPPSTEYSMLSALLAFAILTSAQSCLGITFPAFEADVIPKEKRGRVLASLAIAGSLAGAAGQALSGFEYERIDPRFPFIKLTVLMALCFLIVLFFIKEPVKKEQ